MSLLDYERRFSELRMNKKGGNTSPHKVAMLLAVMDRVADGTIDSNAIRFDESLRKAFSLRFDQLKGTDDRDTPHLPYFHLRSEGFWHHQIRPGKADAYRDLKTAASPSTIDQYIVHAYVDDELFELLQNSYARNFLGSALRRSLSDHDRSELLGAANGWTWLECEAIVQNYFQMLEQQLKGESYSKAAHRRALMLKLNNRSEGSIEFKHRNISAVLLEFGQSYIRGYKPAFNYQQQLKQVVLAHIAGSPAEFERILDTADTEVDLADREIEWAAVFDPELPERLPTIQEPKRQYLARRTNYSERESRNRKLGELGEAFVLEYERYRLSQQGRPDLAREVAWHSVDQGDGLGYDPTPRQSPFFN